MSTASPVGPALAATSALGAAGRPPSNWSLPPALARLLEAPADGARAPDTAALASAVLLVPVLMTLATLAVWAATYSIKRLSHAWRTSSSRRQDAAAVSGGAVFSAAAVATMWLGLGEYREALDQDLGGLGRALCYEVPTRVVSGEDSVFGQHLEYTGPHGDPWFDNRWMAAYTALCFAALAAGTAVALRRWCANVRREEAAPRPRGSQRRLSAHTRTISEDALRIADASLDVRRLRGVVMAWIVSLSGVAFVFAPMPISRVLTFTGVSHNIVEWVLIYELAFRGARPALRGVARRAFTFWVAVEFLGALVFGPIRSQWLVFGLMGAVADVALVASACAFYARKPSRHRSQLLRGILSHFVYVILYFVNCSLAPPMAKVIGLYLNCVALWFAAAYLAPREGTLEGVREEGEKRD